MKFTLDGTLASSIVTLSILALLIVAIFMTFSLRSTMAEVQTDVSAMLADMSTLVADVGELATSTKELKVEMDGLRTNMGSLALAVTALAESSSNLLERIKDHDTQVQNRITKTESLVVNGNRMTVNLRTVLFDDKGFLIPHLAGSIANISTIQDLEEGLELRCLFGLGTSDGFFVIPFTEVGGPNQFDQPQFLCKTPKEVKFVYILPDDLPSDALIVNLGYLKFPLDSILEEQGDFD